MSQVTLVTPIGPSWNLAWLQELAYSVLASTSHPIQWIIVSDGEPLREIHQVIRKIVKNTEITVKFVGLNTRQGPAAARNAALRYIQSSWVLAVDHDDVLLPNSLDLLLQAAEENVTEWAAGITIETDEFGNPLAAEPHNPFSSRKRLTKNSFFLYRKNQGHYPFQTHGGALVSTSYVQEHGWDTGMSNWGDHLAFFTALSSAHEGAWVNTPVLLHRNHKNSLQTRNAAVTKEMEQIIYNRLSQMTK